MTTQEALQKIRALFADAAPPADPGAPAPAPIEYALADGTKVFIDQLAQGGKVSIEDGAGGYVAAPAGDHTLADGTIISLDESGTITNISAPAATPDPAAAMQQQIQDIQSQLSAYKEASEAAFSDARAKLKDQAEKVIALKDLLIEIIEAPSASITNEPKQKFKHHESYEEKVNRFLATVKKIK